MKKIYDSIIGVFPVDWDFLRARHQELMEGLSENCPVLYVENALNLPLFIKNVFKNKSLSGIKNVLKGTRKISDTLYVYKPVDLFPFSLKNRFFNCINQRILSLFIKHNAKKLNMNAPLLWLSYPKNFLVSRFLKHSLLCYDCVDEHSLYNMKKNYFVEKLETKLAHEACVIFASSKNLYKKMKEKNNNTYYVPNGVRKDFIDCSVQPPEEIERFFRTIKKPVIGYTGALNNWIDYNLLYELVTKKTEWSFVIAGPVMPGCEKTFFPIRKQKNVFYTGAVKHHELPFYVHNFDICLILYILNELTNYILPIKVFEYFASGTGVVSTPLPELTPYKDYITFGKNSQEFITGIEKLLGNTSPEFRKKMKETALKNTWEERINNVKEILSGICEL